MGGAPVCVSTVPTVTTLTLSSRRKATPFRIILWRCWARSEHGIARLRTHEPQWRNFYRVRPIQLLDPPCRSTDLFQPAGPGGAVDHVASIQESRLFRCPGAAFLQRRRRDNGSEFGEDLRVVAFE